MSHREILIVILLLDLIFAAHKNRNILFQLPFLGLCGNRAEHLSGDSNHKGKVSRKKPNGPNMSPKRIIQPSKCFKAFNGGRILDHSVQLHNVLFLANPTLCSKIWSKTLRDRKVQAQLQLFENYDILRVPQLFLPQLQLLVQRNNKVQHSCPVCHPVLPQRLPHGVLFHRPLFHFCKRLHPKWRGDSSKNYLLCFKKAETSRAKKTETSRAQKTETSWAKKAHSTHPTSSSGFRISRWGEELQEYAGQRW